MDFFPIFLNLRGQVVVLAGAGNVAERKARLLLQASARIRVVARELNPQFQKWLAAGQIEHLGWEYRPEQLHGARLVFAASSDRDLNGRIYADAEQAGVLVNVVDDPAHCRFISPAIIDRSPIQVAISTGGSSPVLARVIRGWIERLLPLGLGRVAAAAGALRTAVKEALPQTARRGFWERLLQEKAVRSWSLQDGQQIERQMHTALAETAARQLQEIEQPEKLHSGKQHSGKVFLVGAGPGRADLLTLRALHVLGQADVILHDQLVSDEVLDLARRDADRIDVGKRAGDHHQSQQEIHALMLREARLGRTVIRLKGGDPFIFGRGGEELEFLREHDINYEVVPGISAALACAAYSGIPLTHRDHAAALTFVTGHSAAGKPPQGHSGVQWQAIAGEGRTTAIYMGLKQAASIRQELLQAGISGELPIALIANGSRENQRVLYGSVMQLPQLAAAIEPGAPTLLIIGQVAALGSTLSWFQHQPSLLAAA
ncbi:MAG TPA: siroheme synthase CysG [Xanthomonadales bacterium]|nr:siroheme synthase CysG [Xanthomonadales bacterium]